MMWYFYTYKFEINCYSTKSWRFVYIYIAVLFITYITCNYICSISLSIKINWFFTHMHAATTALISLKNLFDLRYDTFYVKMTKICSKQNMFYIICEPWTNILLFWINKIDLDILIKWKNSWSEESVV